MIIKGSLFRCFMAFFFAGFGILVLWGLIDTVFIDKEYLSYEAKHWAFALLFWIPSSLLMFFFSRMILYYFELTDDALIIKNYIGKRTIKSYTYKELYSVSILDHFEGPAYLWVHTKNSDPKYRAESMGKKDWMKLAELLREKDVSVFNVFE